MSIIVPALPHRREALDLAHLGLAQPIILRELADTAGDGAFDAAAIAATDPKTLSHAVGPGLSGYRAVLLRLWGPSAGREDVSLWTWPERGMGLCRYRATVAFAGPAVTNQHPVTKVTGTDSFAEASSESLIVYTQGDKSVLVLPAAADQVAGYPVAILVDLLGADAFALFMHGTTGARVASAQIIQ